MRRDDGVDTISARDAEELGVAEVVGEIHTFYIERFICSVVQFYPIVFFSVLIDKDTV